MKKDNYIEELKEKLKRGTISYFDLSKEETEKVRQALEEEIINNKADITKIKDKIEIEKKKILNKN